MSLLQALEPSMAKAKGRSFAKKRERLREMLWPNSSHLVWNRTREKGFTTMPRTLPLILELLRRLSKKGDPSSVYFDLWSRAFDEGTINVIDEQEFAFSAGYSGTRAIRSWRERMQELEALGFIKVKEQGNREIGHVLLVNPHLAVARLRAVGKPSIGDDWWNAFVARLTAIGAMLPVAEDVDVKNDEGEVQK